MFCEGIAGETSVMTYHMYKHISGTPTFYNHLFMPQVMLQFNGIWTFAIYVRKHYPKY